MLAALSYHYYLAQVAQRQLGQRPLGQQLGQPSFNRAFWLSFGLVGIGLVGTSRQAWETGIWSLFTLYCLFNLALLLRRQPTGEQK